MPRRIAHIPTLLPNNQGQKSFYFFVETPKGSPKRLKFFRWLRGHYLGKKAIIMDISGVKVSVYL